ncbi:MAG: putative Ig domain-containing protein, partial [Pirellulales bacterium]
VITSYEVEPSGTVAPSFDNSNIDQTGRITWTPLDGGVFKIALKATDQYGAATVATYGITVLHNSSPKVDAAGPISPAFLGQPFEHAYTINDPNGDPISVTLNPEAVAAGLTIVDPDPAGPEPDVWKLQWTNPNVLATIPVKIRVEDDQGGSVNVSFELPVFNPDNPNAPQVPDLGGPITIPAERAFEFLVYAKSPHGGPLAFSLQPRDTTTLPDGIRIIPTGLAGLILWTPTIDQVNPIDQSYQLTVVVDAGQGNTASLDIDLTVVRPENFVPLPPSIVSNPPTAATAEQRFVYDPQTAGPSASSLQWFLDVKPDGMSIDRQTGQITWTPDAELIGSVVDVELRVADALGAGSSQRFTLDVSGVNRPPRIETTFPNKWKLGEPFEFDVPATDPEGHALVYEILTPAGAALASETYDISISDSGHIQWLTPSLGTHALLVRVSEKYQPSSYAEQTIILDVVDGNINRTPIVLGSPHGSYASIGQPFVFQFSVADPDQPVDTDFAFAIIAGNPVGSNMDIDASGRFTWTPQTAAVGSRTVKIEVTDTAAFGNPASTFVTFTLEAVVNEAPRVTSATVSAVVGMPLSHQVRASDPEQGPLTFAIDPDAGNPPADMTIDGTTGVLQWQTPTDVAGATYDVYVLVTDQYNVTTTGRVQVDVAATDTVPPTISFSIVDGDGNTVLPGDRLDATKPLDYYVMWLDVRDNLGVNLPGGGANAQWLLTAYNSGAKKADTLDYQAGGLWHVEFDPNVPNPGLNQGLLTITVDAKDDAANSAVQTFRYYVDDADAAKTARILNVPGDTVVESRFEVYGNAKFLGGEYDLRLTSVDDPDQSVLLAEPRTAEISNDVLGVIDPSLIKSGLYRLYLEVRCPDGCIEAIDERIIEIRNPGSLGTLDLSFTDLSVDLGG